MAAEDELWAGGEDIDMGGEEDDQAGTTKGAGGGGGGRRNLSGGRPSKTTAGKKTCGACCKCKPCCEFALNSNFCTNPCRRALDNVGNACARQGQSEWFKEQTATQEVGGGPDDSGSEPFEFACGLF